MNNNTRGSVLMAYLFHAAANTWSQVFSIDHANPWVGWIMAGLLSGAAAVSHSASQCGVLMQANTLYSVWRRSA
jgi:hypothetical protein